MKTKDRRKCSVLLVREDDSGMQMYTQIVFALRSQYSREQSYEN